MLWTFRFPISLVIKYSIIIGINNIKSNKGKWWIYKWRRWATCTSYRKDIFEKLIYRIKYNININYPINIWKYENL